MKEIVPFSRAKEKVELIQEFTDYGYIIDGEEYIDGINGKWDFSLGFKRHDIIDYVSERMKEFPACKFSKTVPGVLELNELLGEVSGMARVSYCSSGSDAIEMAVRLAQLITKKKHIIVYENSYHGSTFLTSEMTGINIFNGIKQYPDWIHFVPQPEGNSLDPVEKVIREVGAENIACIVKEPFSIQSSTVIPSKEYYSELRAICDKNDIKLIVDEVATGFGRTGKMFGCQRMGIEADIIAFGKAATAGYFPLAGIMTTEEVGSALSRKLFPSGHTHSPPMSGIYSCIKTLNIIKEERLLDNVMRIEQTNSKYGFAYGTYLSMDIGPVNPSIVYSRSVGGDKKMRFMFPLDYTYPILPAAGS